RAALPAPPRPPESRRVVLRDGTRVVVRPVGRRDADAVRDLHGRCSADSRRMRYFSPKPAPPRRAFERFCDPAHGLTLVAEGPDGSLLALAHLIHVLDPGVAEMAFLVEDAWQGRGLGRALAELLVALGRDRGLVELRALALSENTRMRRLLTSLGGQPRRTADPAVVEVRLRLDGRPARSPAVAGLPGDPHPRRSLRVRAGVHVPRRGGRGRREYRVVRPAPRGRAARDGAGAGRGAGRAGPRVRPPRPGRARARFEPADVRPRGRRGGARRREGGG